MKLNHLGRYSGKKSSPLKEALGELDDSAKEELDGDLEDLELDSEMETDTELDQEPNTSIDIESIPEPPDTTEPQGYNLEDVTQQLNGMVDKWFKLASEMPPEKKENFLKLGDRLDEIIEVIKTEFM